MPVVGVRGFGVGFLEIFMNVSEIKKKNVFTIANVERFLRFCIDVIHDFRKYFDKSFADDDVQAVNND